MDRLIIGTYAFLTKIHLLALKDRITRPYTYVRADYDHLIIPYDTKTRIKVAQDGLVYLDTTDTSKTPDEWYEILKDELLNHLIAHDEEAFFNKLLITKHPAIIALTDTNGSVLYERYGRERDYTVKTRFVTKHYGHGLVVYENLTLKGKKREELIETQLFFADYQELARHLLAHNQDIWNKVSTTRRREQFRFKDIPLMINELIEDRRLVTTAMLTIEHIDDFLARRCATCTISKELEALKLNDFDELRVLTKYVHNQYSTTKEHISSTITLTEDLYKENEQKELNILQVIFAVGTIATIVSLGAMPGATLLLEITGNTVSGDIVSFSTIDLIFWTIISITIGIGLFIALNYFFLTAKKLRIVSLIKSTKRAKDEPERIATTPPR
jgi:hypothetical protein